MSETLPAVAKTVYIPCKKCEADRYHVVVAHKSATSAKVKCEICGSQKTYSLPKAQARKPGNTNIGARRKAAAAEARRTAHLDEYNRLLSENEKGEVKSYNMKSCFELNSKLQHPKFGLGVIRMALSDKIEVVFEDEVRSLVHNRG